MKKIISFMIAGIAIIACLSLNTVQAFSAYQDSPANTESGTIELSGEPEVIHVAALKGPTAMGMVKLMDDSRKGESENQYEFTLAGAPDELTGRIIQGEFDIAAVPTNLAATLYNKTEGKIKIAALNTMGVLYIVENGDTIHSFSDLKGQTVYSTGKGAVPEFSFQYLLSVNGLTDDVEVVYKTEHTELAALLAAGQADIALLPQPFVTSVLLQNDQLRVALDLTEEWEKAAGDQGGMTTGCIIVQQEFIDAHPDALRRFLEEYEASINFVTEPANVDEAAELIVDFDIIAKAEIAKKAIPECNIVFKTGTEMRETAGGFLQVLYDANPQSVGGKLPDEGFYYLE